MNSLLRAGFVIGLLLLVGCMGNDTPEKPKNLIPEDKYVSLLVELQLIRSYQQNAPVDSLTIDSLTTAAYQKYDVNKALFQKSHQYYQQFPKEQKERIQQAIEQIQMDQVAKADSVRPGIKN